MTRARGGGRKPVPTKLKLLSGNPGKRPLNEHEPEPERKLPRPPAHLSPAAKREWRRVGRLLLTLGLVSDLDRGALAAYCQAWGRWVEAEESLKRYGVVVKSPSGFPMQSPFLAIANKAMEQMRQFLGEFGMTPASRTRVHADPPAAPDPLDELRRQNGREA
jgi:P27 family predicted phage terminase small subunit